ncbi:MAG: hypothetical protein ACKVH9_10085, partial [Rhodobacterales bacterium]
GIYWKYEQLLRKFENTLGLYMLGTGACSAVRRELYRPISLVDDMDLVTPLDAILQGYKCTYQEKSIAFDVTPDSNKREFNARV